MDVFGVFYELVLQELLDVTCLASGGRETVDHVDN